METVFQRVNEAAEQMREYIVAIVMAACLAETCRAFHGGIQNSVLSASQVACSRSLSAVRSNGEFVSKRAAMGGATMRGASRGLMRRKIRKETETSMGFDVANTLFQLNSIAADTVAVQLSNLTPVSAVRVVCPSPRKITLFSFSPFYFKDYLIIF